MWRLRRSLLRLFHVVRPDAAERELARELDSHLTLLEDEFRRRGSSPADARLAARRTLGGVDQVKELHRDERSPRWLEDARRDLLYAARMLARTPTFSAVAILTLALGIGANAAIFSVVHALLLEPLPYKDSNQLVHLVAMTPAQSPAGQPRRFGGVNVAEILEIRSHSRTLSHAAFTAGPAFMTLIGRGDAARLQGMRVSPGVFETLGEQAFLGRVFGSQEEAPGAASTIIFSYAAWQRYFAGDPGIIGKEVALGDSLAPNSQFELRGFSVVGVMPKDFAFENAQTQFWMPVNWAPTSGGALLARLNDGVPVEAAAAELGGILRGIRPNPPTTVELVRVLDTVVAPVKPALLVLTVAVAFVLLIACVNVANLLLARASARQREMGVRLALGASRGRVIRQLLTESLLLALVSGLAGSAVAFGGTSLLRSLATTFDRIDLGVQLPFPRVEEIGIDASVVAFAVAISAVTGLLCGLAPALGLSKPDRTEILKDGAHAQSGSRVGGRTPVRGLLIVSEIALAMMLLIGGSLLMHSFLKLATVESGYDPANVLTFQVSLPDLAPGTDLKMFADQVVERARLLPGVKAAAYARQVPLVAIKETAWFRRTPHLPNPPPRSMPGAPDARLVSQEYFDVMGIRLIAGRGFGPDDRFGQPRAMVINQTLARQEFPGENPLGRHVYAGRDSSPWQIVGIVADVRQFGLDQDPQPQFFADFRQWSTTDPVLFTILGPYYAIRGGENVQALVPSIRDIVHGLTADAGLYNVATMDQLVSNSLSRPRMYATLLGIFAGVAVVLSAVGIYGVIGYAVAQRTREIGIRMALGAARSDVVRLVLGQSLAWTAIGIALGLGGAAAVTRYLEGLLYGLTPLDVTTFVSASLVFLLIAIAASYIPARRATRVDPVIALRSE